MLILKNAQQFSHEMILSVNLEDGIFIDATAGNGHDTLFMAQHIEKGSKILAFDIQEKAILQTRQLLQNHDFEHKVTFILDSHAQISNYLDDQDLVRLAIFNLGYLYYEAKYLSDETQYFCPAGLEASQEANLHWQCQIGKQALYR